MPFIISTHNLTNKLKNNMSSVVDTLMKNGIGVNPSEGGHDKDMNDCHVWLEDENGKIIDPTPPAYPYKMEYKPFDKTEQIRIWNQYKTKIVSFGKDGRRAMKKQFYENPRSRCCGYNVFAYWSHNKHLKIVVGSAGFHIGKDTIFWEFG